MSKSLLIIGAGIAGLAAGCYAQMNGFDSQICELHTIPGGLCTSWRRQGYLFDGAIRYLIGANHKANAYVMWQELGALQNRSFFDYSEFLAVEDCAGNALHFYSDPYRLEQHMLSLAPDDRGAISDFCNAIRDFADFDLPLDSSPDDALENLHMGLAMLPFAIPLIRWNGVSLRQFAQRFRHPLLRQGISEFMQFSPPDFPLMLALTTLAQLANGMAAYPIGGSLDFAESIAHRYKGLGGKIHYGARVKRILLRQGQAVGVQLENGDEMNADLVISAADGHTTLFEMLGAETVDAQTRALFQSLTPARPILQISMGIKRDLSNQPPALSFPLAQPLTLGNLTLDRLVLKHYAFDPTMADPGKSALSVWCEADYDYWCHLRTDPARYEAEKQAIAGKVVAAIDQRYPGFANDVEVTDVATPVTYQRYTGNWRGSIYGWSMTKRKLDLMIGGGMPKTLPGVQNFYRIGQWVEPGGNVQLSAASGRDVVEMICKKERQLFVTTMPTDA